MPAICVSQIDDLLGPDSPQRFAAKVAPLPARYVNSGPLRLCKSAQPIQLPPKVPKPVPNIREAFHQLKVRQDAFMIWVLTGAR